MSIHHRQGKTGGKARGQSHFATYGEEVVDRDKADSFPKTVECPIEIDTTEEDKAERMTHFGTSQFSALDDSHACLVCSAYQRSHREETDTSSDQATRLR